MFVWFDLLQDQSAVRMLKCTALDTAACFSPFLLSLLAFVFFSKELFTFLFAFFLRNQSIDILLAFWLLFLVNFVDK